MCRCRAVVNVPVFLGCVLLSVFAVRNLDPFGRGLVDREGLRLVTAQLGAGCGENLAVAWACRAFHRDCLGYPGTSTAVRLHGRRGVGYQLMAVHELFLRRFGV